ncbi:MAG TPA: dTDP-4-dehydrorhamnose reductase [Gemmataceae bacterium]|jgi:dTDP-4-dehydrorhamnose reductase
MKIAVLGAQGQLGRDLGPRLAGEVVPLTRADIDLAKPETIAAAIDSIRPDVFVNCAAYNFVDLAETEPAAAFAVNAWGVRVLANACRDVNCKLVHFSTDYVFGLDASRTDPFAETDAPGPVSVYGLSKLAGEYFVRGADPRNLVIRTCGLYGAWGSGGKGGNFVETMLKFARQGKPLSVVDDQLCAPSYTVDVAAAAAGLIRAKAGGLFHVTNGGSCTWYEFAAEIFRQANLTVELKPIPSADYPKPAKRPPYSVLSCDSLAKAGVAAPRPWPEALAAYLAEKASP